jgi:hypothetical protein
MYKLIDYLDNINIKVPKCNTSSYKNFYNYIINLYKTINIKNINTKYIVNEINLTKHNISNNAMNNNNDNKDKIKFMENSNILKIINYYHYNNSLDNLLYNYLDEDKEFFKKLLEQQNYNGLILFLNKNGGTLNNNINNLSINNKLPKNIYIHDNDIYNQFISLTNILSIETMTYLHNYNIVYNTFTINLNIYNQTKSISKKLVNKIIRLTLLMCLFKNKNNISVNIDIYLTTNKKLLPLYYKNLGCNEVNSGLSLQYSNRKKIIIFRIEELNKVLIHELIHYLDLDLDHSIIHNFNNNFDINTQLKINETYTELIANLINCFIFSYEYNNKKDLALVKELLEYELKFSCYQSAKILVHYGYKDCKNFFKPHNSNLFIQNSAIFEYYILKTALLYNLDYVLKLFISNYNQSYLLENTTNFSSTYINLLLYCSTQKEFINKLTEFFKYIYNNKKPPLLYKNLRMTLFG